MKKFICVSFLIILLSPLEVLAESSAQCNLRHGNLQVSRMLSDRPRMSKVKSQDGRIIKVTKKDAIWIWAAKAYGQKINGEVVEWNNSKIKKPIHYRAEHSIPHNGKKGFIRIRKILKDRHGQIRQATFDELWKACVFELFNIQSAKKFVAVYHKALTGKLTKEEWVRLNIKIEYDAFAKLKEFYKTVWVQWSKKNGYRISRAWAGTVPDSYEKYIQLHLRGSSYQYWENYFDQKIVPYLKKTGKL